MLAVDKSAWAIVISHGRRICTHCLRTSIPNERGQCRGAGAAAGAAQRPAAQLSPFMPHRARPTARLLPPARPPIVPAAVWAMAWANVGLWTLCLLASLKDCCSVKKQAPAEPQYPAGEWLAAVWLWVRGGRCQGGGGEGRRSRRRVRNEFFARLEPLSPPPPSPQARTRSPCSRTCTTQPLPPVRTLPPCRPPCVLPVCEAVRPRNSCAVLWWATRDEPQEVSRGPTDQTSLSVPLPPPPSRRRPCILRRSPWCRLPARRPACWLPPRRPAALAVCCHPRRARRLPAPVSDGAAGARLSVALCCGGMSHAVVCTPAVGGHPDGQPLCLSLLPPLPGCITCTAFGMPSCFPEFLPPTFS